MDVEGGYDRFSTSPPFVLFSSFGCVLLWSSESFWFCRFWKSHDFQGVILVSCLLLSSLWSLFFDQQWAHLYRTVVVVIRSAVFVHLPFKIPVTVVVVIRSAVFVYLPLDSGD